MLKLVMKPLISAVPQPRQPLHKQSLQMFHYDRDVIKLGKQGVGVLAVVGLAVECFLALAYHSRKGFNVLRCFNVKFVTVRKCTVNDVYKSSVEVEVEPDLAERALRIARAIG